MANSLINFVLFHIILPSVSSITKGNGEFISVLLAALSTSNVKSCICSESSAFLLFVVYALDNNIIINIKIAGVMKLVS